LRDKARVLEVAPHAAVTWVYVSTGIVGRLKETVYWPDPREWYDRLNAEAARKVTTALYRVGPGNFSNAKSVGAGVYECKINFGPGYRVGKEGEQIVILLSGGTKQRQQSDIRLALERWEDYKQRKKQQKEKEGE
jgi:putative addiction module killer protein